MIAARLAGFARQRLLRQPALFVVLLRGGELIAQRAAHFAVQIIALKAGDFLPIPQHAMHMAAAVGEPIGALAIGPDAGDTIAERVVFVRPRELLALTKQAVVVRFADQIADFVKLKTTFAKLIFGGVNPAKGIVFKALAAAAAGALDHATGVVVGEGSDLAGFVDLL